MAKLELGLIVGISKNAAETFKKVADLGIPTCQMTGGAEALMKGDYPSAGKMREEADKAGVRISAIFLAWEGQRYDNVNGPDTMGLVPPDLRAERLASGKKFADWGKEMGVEHIVSHIGFIPDDENDPRYAGFIDTMKDISEHCAKNDQLFLFETGQELPSTLKRTILDTGTGNLFVNLDPANLVLYGKANPLDAVEIFGEYVKGMHAKDGVWPNRDESLGHETALGEGMVQFDLLLRRLKEKGFEGPVTIEREISGDQQIADIKMAMDLLDPML